MSNSTEIVVIIAVLNREGKGVVRGAEQGAERGYGLTHFFCFFCYN